MTSGGVAYFISAVSKRLYEGKVPGRDKERDHCSDHCLQVGIKYCLLIYTCTSVLLISAKNVFRGVVLNSSLVSGL